MNMTGVHIGESSHKYYSSDRFVIGKSIFAQNTMLKSTQEKIDRQNKAASQVEFWENQKENLKNREADSVEEVSKKLELLHSYEEEITSTKAAYNQEQMFHMLDEAKEMGEKIAEKVEEMRPKTKEERKEEMVEEALGVEENKGMLEEITEEFSEIIEETKEQLKEIEEVMEDSFLKETEELETMKNGDLWGMKAVQIYDKDYKKELFHIEYRI